ncbi:heme ABC transporter [Mannheimia granulomatis]|uniref:Leukotoxin translocation ATP-binding protein LktB n=1 Tax=Mannheimia granulomatis TaxID=85402 RepID=A0A011NDE4_9PAST|nr:ABC transporter ATP-binding protein [Mannheimia granulomatis]EXI62537.1 heme ABC transporter [Mannheimia granulomatis]RGE47835.1 heme ABC transporter [Mannheimia granulomatis]
MIKIEDLTLSYGIKNLSCVLLQGKLIGILGANGAGKSSLLKAMAGILPPTSGQIWLENCKIGELSPQQRSGKLAYLAQNLPVAWQLSAYEVIALGLAKQLPTQVEQEKVRSVAEKFSIQHLLDKPYQQLSGGEKTRVHLARCCIKNASILLADEPIAALDPYYQIDIMQQLKALTPQQTCVLVIHHLPLAYRFCDEIILLKDGNLLAAGNTQAVINAENLAKAFGVKAEIDWEKREIWGIEKLA